MVTWLRLAPLCVLAACTYETPTEGGPGPEAKPLVGFEFPMSGADEASGTVMIPVKLSKPSDQPVTVAYSALNGNTADPGVDFVVSGNQLVFDPGVVELQVPVEIKSDTNETESAETFQLALTNAVGADLDMERAIHDVRISDHLLPRINFEIADSSYTEGGTKTTLTLVFTMPDNVTPVPTEPDGSTVVIGVAGGATDPTDAEDLALADGTELAIPGNVMTFDLALDEVDDGLDEEDLENLVLQLKGASQNLVLGGNIQHLHTIADDDAAPQVRFQVLSSNINEDGVQAVIAVELTEESGRAANVTADIARDAGSTADVTADATIATTQVSFAPRKNGVAGETLKMVTITIVDDTTDENPEDLILDLVNLVNLDLGNQPKHTLTINADNADPAPVITWEAQTDSVDEDLGNNNKTAVVKLSAVSGKDVSVTVTVDNSSTATNVQNGGDDFDMPVTQTVTITAGSPSKGVVIDVRKNDPPNAESPETVVLVLSSPSNGTLDNPPTRTYTLTIIE